MVSQNESIAIFILVCHQMQTTLAAPLRAGAADDDAAAVAAAAVAARRGGDYVPREQHGRLEIELATTKEQLIETLEELNSRELELTEVSFHSHSGGTMPNEGLQAPKTVHA
jgi:hypothetical protein